jgi:drug/metabolite transporter (DMT)-like permease
VRRFAAEGALVLAAFFFGVTFPLVHDALGDIEPFAYLVLRFAIAVVVIAPFAIVIGRRRHADRRMLLRVGVIAGILLAAGYAAQTVGLAEIRRPRRRSSPGSTSCSPRWWKESCDASSHPGR